MLPKRNSAHREAPIRLFHYNSAARIPAHVQIEEQVKVALALGRLRPGDVLPSIRSVEDTLGIGRMLVRKAYQELQAAGLVRVIHGWGAVVTDQARANGHLPKKAEALMQRLLAELRRDGVEPLTFSRFLHQRLQEEDARSPRILCVDSSDVLARELGRQIQQALGVHVRTAGVNKLRALARSLTQDTQVLVDYYYLADVRAILKGRARRIYPVSWDYDPRFIERIRSLPVGSSILLLFYRSSLREQGTLLAIDALLERFKERDFKIDVRAVEQMGSLERLGRSRYAAVLVSNRVWDEHAATLEKFPSKVWRLAARLDLQSLEALRDRLGLVL